MRVLVTGGGGQVGRVLAATAPAGYEVQVKSHAELDIGDAGAVGTALGADGARWIINAAAYTAVDRAQSEPDRARAINDTAVGVLAGAARAAGARLLQLSTDFVFDGRANQPYRPEDPPNPLSVYGRTKLGGEHQAETGGCRAIVLRTAWVYAAEGQNFVLTMLRLMRERESVRVVADQIGAPTWARGLAAAIWDLLARDAPAGIQHWTDLGVASWYDFAVAIQDEALARGLLARRVPIEPISTPEYPTPARRPAFSVLDTRATRALVATPARHWRHSLQGMFDELRPA
ncbi:MAG TPA: dTDP-4-dehydrorhamnose reductase [Steroidobacteraceae bacterium]|nr:dTDP-4-dehydrorhamnose reductase [Steroidobacteraceae bacterium]